MQLDIEFLIKAMQVLTLIYYYGIFLITPFFVRTNLTRTAKLILVKK